MVTLEEVGNANTKSASNVNLPRRGRGSLSALNPAEARRAAARKVGDLAQAVASSSSPLSKRRHD